MTGKKKKLIKLFIIVGISLLCLFILSVILEKVVLSHSTPKLDYDFYVAEEPEDIHEDSAYLQKDRTLYYTDEMGQCWQINTAADNGDIGAKFFYLYFYCLEEGDYETFNTLFSDEFEDYAPFTTQRTYAKEVKYLYDEQIDDNTYSITYSLDYNIMKNDGSFRRDIGSDMSRTQYITLYYNSEEAWIEEVKSEFRK